MTVDDRFSNAGPALVQGWARLAVLVLALAATGLPVNAIADYAALLAVAVIAAVGVVRMSAPAWAGALALVVVAGLAQAFMPVPRIQEGHNVFLPGQTLERALPAPVYRALKEQFDAAYPPSVRCDASQPACWQRLGKPDGAYAFSADGLWRKTTASRSVVALDFNTAVRLRLGFSNEVRYNWGVEPPDLHRSERDKRPWAGLSRWRLAMPWYQMVELPAAYVGGEMCWRGDLLWEGERDSFTRWRGEACRPIEADDAGKRVFGLAVTPESLGMQLVPPVGVQLLVALKRALAALAPIGVVLLLVRFERRRIVMPALLVALSLIVIAVDDASFIGGLRPFDGGDDGLFYDGVGRILLHKLMAGDIVGFLEGNEPVYYYGGPGLRYFRALEHVVFGESYFGYLSLVLVLPFVAWRLFRRFLSETWAVALALLFVAVPLGVLFGTSFVLYQKWASRGFADPAAYILFAAGLAVLVGATARGPAPRFLPAFFAALLFALGIFMKPIVAPAAAVLLGGAGLAALYRRQIARLAGLCIGFLPVFSMALHNWVFGRVFVLFSSNAGDANLLVMPPSAWLAVVTDLLHGRIGEPARRAVTQLADWLSGPAESYWTIPLNAAGVAIVVWVVLRGRRLDPWLRLIGLSALAQHAVALFYNAATARYHFVTWFMTMLVTMVWFHDVGIVWLAQRYPALTERIANHRVARQLASALTRLQKASA